MRLHAKLRHGAGGESTRHDQVTSTCLAWLQTSGAT